VVVAEEIDSSSAPVLGPSKTLTPETLRAFHVSNIDFDIFKRDFANTCSAYCEVLRRLIQVFTFPFPL